MAVRKRKPLGEGNTYADEVIRAWDRMEQAEETAIAYCFASGQIEIGAEAPEGAIAFAKGPKDALARLVEATARHAYDGKTMLVPGVPEAANQMDAIDALIRFVEWLRQGDREKSYGVEILGGRGPSRRRRAALEVVS